MHTVPPPILDEMQCLDEEEVDGFVLATLSEERLGRVEAHLLWCETCLQSVRETEFLVALLRLGAPGLLRHFRIMRILSRCGPPRFPVAPGDVL